VVHKTDQECLIESFKEQGYEKEIHTFDLAGEQANGCYHEIVIHALDEDGQDKKEEVGVVNVVWENMPGIWSYRSGLFHKQDNK
jgi:hypothetical protein